MSTFILKRQKYPSTSPCIFLRETFFSIVEACMYMLKATPFICHLSLSTDQRRMTPLSGGSEIPLGSPLNLKRPKRYFAGATFNLNFFHLTVPSGLVLFSMHNLKQLTNDHKLPRTFNLANYFCPYPNVHLRVSLQSFHSFFLQRARLLRATAP